MIKKKHWGEIYEKINRFVYVFVYFCIGSRLFLYFLNKWLYGLFFYKVSSSACAIRVCICLIIDYETRIEVLKKNNTGTIKTRQHRSQHAKQRVFQRIDNGGKCNGEFTSCTRGRLLNVLWCRNILFNVNFKSCFLNNKKYTRKRLKKEKKKEKKKHLYVLTWR